MTRRAVVAERAALAGLQGGCNLPMAAWARDVADDKTSAEVPTLVIDAAVFDPDGRARVAVALSDRQDDPESLGYRAAQALRDQGATPLLELSVSADNPPG